MLYFVSTISLETCRSVVSHMVCTILTCSLSVQVRAQRLIIPSLDYIHFESKRYRKEKLHSVLEFDT